MYSRQFATMAGMVLLSFLMLGASFATLSYQYTIREKKDVLERNAGYIASFTSAYIRANPGYITPSGSEAWRAPEFQSYINTIALVSDTHIMVGTNDGLVLYGTDGQSELTRLEGQTLPGQLLSAIEGGSYVGMTNLGGLYAESRYLVALPIATSEGFVQGLVLVSSDASNISGMWKDLSAIFLVTSCAVVLITAIISSMTSMQQSRPLHRIADAARQFGHGDLDVRVDVGRRQDEIGELAEAFNAMADSLAKSEERRTEFIANVSHELKTPMTTIAGFADGILDGTIPPEREKEYLQVISSETRRLSRLVRSMLDISRLRSSGEGAAQAEFDVNEVLLRVLVSLEGKINARELTVDTSLPEEPTLVWGDPDAITQVCYNLLDNAVKFSRTGGRLSLEIKSKGPKAYITIGNEGETIPTEELSLIFDRFHKSDRSRSLDREGVGLGLYIVKTILNSHKENISCTSEGGVTKFTFTLTKA